MAVEVYFGKLKGRRLVYCYILAAFDSSFGRWHLGFEAEGTYGEWCQDNMSFSSLWSKCKHHSYSNSNPIESYTF